MFSCQPSQVSSRAGRQMEVVSSCRHSRIKENGFPASVKFDPGTESRWVEGSCDEIRGVDFPVGYHPSAPLPYF